MRREAAVTKWWQNKKQLAIHNEKQLLVNDIDINWANCIP